MKKTVLLFALCCLSIAASAQFRVNNNGKVTIASGMAVDGDLQVSGMLDATIIGEAGGQDISAMADGQDSAPAHEKLSGLDALGYYRPAPAATTQDGGTTAGQRTLGVIEAQAAQKMHYALSAEQLEAVYPDLVYMRPDGTKGINYVELIPILVEAIGELNAKVQQLEQGGKARLAPMASGSGGSVGNAVAATLGQNSPNPFAATTAISLSIPTDAKSAQLCIYDMTGRQVRQLPIDARGATSVSVAAAGMPAGMYLYSLIVDDSLIDTKRMVVGQ